MRLKIQRFRKVQKRQSSKKIDVDKLKDQDIKCVIRERLENKMKKVKESAPAEVEKVWGNIKTAIIETQEQEIGHVAYSKRQEWMTSEILDLMSERRTQKSNPVNYKTLDRAVKNKCKEAKEKWL